MPQEIKARIDSIFNLEVKSKVVDDKDTGRDIVTVVKFGCHASPKDFDLCLVALREHHQLNVLISSPQLMLEGVGDKVEKSLEQQLGLD